MNEALIYVYCLANSNPGILENTATSGLKVIHLDRFYVIAKNVSEEEFSEENLKIKLSDILWLEPKAREHIATIGRIMEKCTIIPFKFGTIFTSEANLLTFIMDYSDSLTESMMQIDQKEEWSVKIYCDRKVLGYQIDEVSEDAALFEKQIMASSPGKAFLLKRKKNDLILSEMDRLCKIYGQEIYMELGSLSHATCLNNLTPAEYTGRTDDMILNATFLVPKEKISEFISATGVLHKKYAGKGFDFETTGPWPPFSFISIKEKL
jgi:hypothetical protein